MALLFGPRGRRGAGSTPDVQSGRASCAGGAVVVRASTTPARRGPRPYGRPLGPLGASESTGRSCSGRAVAGEPGAPMAARGGGRRGARLLRGRYRIYLSVLLVGMQQPDSFHTHAS